MPASASRVLTAAAVSGILVLFLGGCSDEQSGIDLRKVGKTTRRPLSDIPEQALSIEQKAIDTFLLQGQPYTAARLIVFLQEQSDSALSHGILFRSDRKETQELDELLISLCVKRNANLYMISPAGKALQPDPVWVVRSTRPIP